MSSRVNMDLIQNGIDQLKGLALDLDEDLSFYAARPNANQKYIAIHQKRIDSLLIVCQMFTQVYNNIKNNVNNQSANKLQTQQAIFAREACAFFYGVSHLEMSFFLNRPMQAVEADIDQAIKTGFRQVPFAFRDFIDENKRQIAFNELQIKLDAQGNTQYIRPPIAPIKTATEPVFDWKRSLQNLQNLKAPKN